MAERHVIVVRVRDGAVAEVEFCDCCPDVTVEVRAYTDDPEAAAKAQPVWYLGGDAMASSVYQRDAHGVFRLACYQTDDEDE